MSQTLVKNHLHIVFSTKGRYNLIQPSVEDSLFGYLATVTKDKGCTAVKIGGYLNHVHLLINLSKNISLSDYMQVIKSNSSRWMKSNGEHRTFQWQDGYAAFGVSESHLAVVKAYVSNQKEHHQKEGENFKNELTRLFKENGLDYDERYLWS